MLMEIVIESKGDFSQITKWLKKAGDKTPEQAFNKIGRDGVESLARTTPVGRTGLTSQGWSYKINRDARGMEVAFYNNAHPQEAVNIAKIIRLGHGTGTGGYVPPYDYITPAMTRIHAYAGDLIVKEVMR